MRIGVEDKNSMGRIMFVAANRSNALAVGRSCSNERRMEPLHRWQSARRGVIEGEPDVFVKTSTKETIETVSLRVSREISAESARLFFFGKDLDFVLEHSVCHNPDYNEMKMKHVASSTRKAVGRTCRRDASTHLHTQLLDRRVLHRVCCTDSEW